MGFLNNSLSQLRDLFTSMTPAARITAALLLGVIVVSIGYLFQGYSGGGDEPLFGGELLPPQEVARIEMAFADANLTILPRQAGRIMVPRGQKTAYLAAIVQASAQPANFDTLLDESLNGGLMESGEKGKQRFKAARERQLSMMVSMMDGVEEAKVLYDASDARGFTKQKVTATISLRPAPGVDLTPQAEKTIRMAVAGAIAGLDFKDVTILNLQDLSRSGGGSEVTAASFDEPYFQTRVNYEQLMKSKIEDLLHDIPGVRVQVAAELDPTLRTESHTVKTEGDSTPYRESTEKKVVKTAALEDRGPPGLDAQGPIRRGAPVESVAGATNENTSNVSDTDSFIPTANEVRLQAGLEPQRVRATITVPSEYLLRVYYEQTPGADRSQPPDDTRLTQIKETETEKIQKSVTKLLPREIAEANYYPDVEVAFIQSLTPDAVEPPSLASEGLMWANANSGSLVMAGLALVSLLMLRSMVKAIPPADPNIAFSSPTLAAEAKRAEQAATASSAAPASSSLGKAGPRPRLRLKKGPTLKDDLSEMVREDPDGAAAVLRSWIGNAA